MLAVAGAYTHTHSRVEIPALLLPGNLNKHKRLWTEAEAQGRDSGSHPAPGMIKV